MTDEFKGSPEEAEQSASENASHAGEREDKVWRGFLESLASDSEAALAAAMTYREMDSEQRDDWLQSLLEAAGKLNVPSFAVFAPLLAVEEDPQRRARLVLLQEEFGDADFDSSSTERPRAYWSVAENFRVNDSSSDRLLVFVLPLYLNFVQVLAVKLAQGGLDWVRHEPILNREKAPQVHERVDGLRIESVPLSSALDLLAQAIVAKKREGGQLPEALTVIADWLNPQMDTPTPGQYDGENEA